MSRNQTASAGQSTKSGEILRGPTSSIVQCRATVCDASHVVPLRRESRRLPPKPKPEFEGFVHSSYSLVVEWNTWIGSFVLWTARRVVTKTAISSTEEKMEFAGLEIFAFHTQEMVLRFLRDQLERRGLTQSTTTQTFHGILWVAKIF
jgi:hypothetical protein